MLSSRNDAYQATRCFHRLLRSAADVAAATQFTGELNTVPKKSATAITVGKVTDEMKDFKAYYALRQARNEAKLQGSRDKKKRELAAKD